MDTEGLFAPETARAARERYESVGPPAQVVVREVATAMEFDRAEYRERVTSDVIETARDALFASLLEVRVGSRESFEDWCERHAEYAVHATGSENVERVVWHTAPAAEAIVAATFHEKREAAVSTLRRQAFGRVYRDLLEGDDADDTS